MPNVTGHTELVGLMAYPIRHTQSPTTHNLAYDKNGDDVIQLAFEVDNDSLKDAVQSIRALKMLGSNISMPNKTVVHKYLDEVDEAAKLCGAINTVVNMRDENGQVTGKLKGYNTDGMGYWQGLKEEGIDFKGMKMVLIGTGGAATAIAVRGALDGIAEIEIFNIKDKFYSRGEEIVDLINKNTNCKATTTKSPWNQRSTGFFCSFCSHFCLHFSPLYQKAERALCFILCLAVSALFSTPRHITEAPGASSASGACMISAAALPPGQRP